MRDEIKNLLEVGSTISHIGLDSSGKMKVDLVKSSDEWFQTEFEQRLCFGCKRLFIESNDKSKLFASLPTNMTATHTVL